MITTIKMSSKGQIVIPQDIRKQMKASEGTVFAVAGTEDSVVLKKIEVPSKEELIRELRKISEKYTQKLKKKGFTEADLRAI